MIEAIWLDSLLVESPTLDEESGDRIPEKLRVSSNLGQKYAEFNSNSSGSSQVILRLVSGPS